MKHVRALLIVMLTITLPLPATAAAFGAPPCMHQSSSLSTSTAQSLSKNSAQADCCCKHCDDCATCDAPCATGGVATFNSLPLVAPDAPLFGSRVLTRTAKPLPAHPEDPLRPPVVS